jgi:hypothetical protein
MTISPDPRECPDCDDPLAFAFIDTSGVGAHKRGDNFNTVPDTVHYICFACAKAWKQRLDGPLTPDIVGQLAFFTCRHTDCGREMRVTRESTVPTEIEVGCSAGHRFSVRAADGGGLTLEK